MCLGYICSAIIYQLTCTVMSEQMHVYHKIHHPDNATTGYQGYGFISNHNQTDDDNFFIRHVSVFYVATFEYLVVALVVVLSILWDVGAEKSPKNVAEPFIIVSIDQPNPITQGVETEEEQPSTSSGGGQEAQNSAAVDLQKKDHKQTPADEEPAVNGQPPVDLHADSHPDNWGEIIGVIVLSIGLAAIIIFPQYFANHTTGKLSTVLTWTYFALCTGLLCALNMVCIFLFFTGMILPSNAHSKTELNAAHKLDKIFFYFGATLMFVFVAATSLFLGAHRLSTLSDSNYFNIMIIWQSMGQAIVQAVVLVTYKIRGRRGIWGIGFLACGNLTLFFIDIWDAGELGINVMPVEEAFNLTMLQIIRGLASVCLFFRFHSTSMFMAMAEHAVHHDDSTPDILCRYTLANEGAGRLAYKITSANHNLNGIMESKECASLIVDEGLVLTFAAAADNITEPFEGSKPTVSLIIPSISSL